MTPGFGLGQTSAFAELVDRQVTASVEPGYGQGSTVAGQRKGMDWASCWKDFGEGFRVLLQTQSLDTWKQSLNFSHLVG